MNLDPGCGLTPAVVQHQSVRTGLGLGPVPGKRRNGRRTKAVRTIFGVGRGNGRSNGSSSDLIGQIVSDEVDSIASENGRNRATMRPSRIVLGMRVYRLKRSFTLYGKYVRYGLLTS